MLAGAGVFLESGTLKQCSKTCCHSFVPQHKVCPKPFSVHIGRLRDGEIEKFMINASADGRTDPEKNNPTGLSAEQAQREARRCLHCDCRKYDTCKLRIYAEKYRARPNRYKQTRPIFEQNIQHPEIIFEPGKCINCDLCVQIAAAAGEKPGLTFAGRGFDVHVQVPFNDSLKEALTKTAVQCAAACPTGALSLSPLPTPASEPRTTTSGP